MQTSSKQMFHSEYKFQKGGFAVFKHVNLFIKCTQNGRCFIDSASSSARDKCMWIFTGKKKKKSSDLAICEHLPVNLHLWLADLTTCHVLS